MTDQPATDVRLTQYSHGGGCACKLGTSELAEVLKHVRTTSTDPHLLVGLDTPDDAAVYRLTDDIAIVQTVDFFTPVVDDPRSWGRIAAANALSDVYAMGGKPITALNLVGWPRALDFELLGRVLEGAEEICAAAGVSIVGGHSVDDPEPKYGLAVTGTIDPRAIVRKAGGSPGSALILTKALGTGIVSSAIKEGKAAAEVAEAAIRSMSTLNRAAAEAMIEVGAEAGTDITGFGLAAHLGQMLGTSLSARLDFSSIPLLPGALELAEAGVWPGGSRRNAEAMGGRVNSPDLSEAQRKLLFDAQTSGGLLIATENPDRLLEVLADRGVESAARIGSLVDGHGNIEVAA